MTKVDKEIIHGSLHTGKDGEDKFSKSIPMHSYDKERELLNYKYLDLYFLLFLYAPSESYFSHLKIQD